MRYVFCTLHYSIALTQVRQQRALEEASESAGTDTMSPDAIPGILLNVAIVNLFSDLQVSPRSCRQTSSMLLTSVNI